MGALSNAEGKYEISVHVGDTLFFSSLQYEPHRMVISSRVIQQNRTLVYLYPLVNKLEEVTLSNSDLTGNLTKDAAKFDTYYFDYKKYGLSTPLPQPTVAQRRLYTATTGGGGSAMSLDPIINYFSGRLTMLKCQCKYEVEKDWLSKGKRAMGTVFFTKELKLPKEYVDDFLYFCLKDPLYKTLVLKDYFKLIAFFQHKKVDYHHWKGWTAK